MKIVSISWVRNECDVIEAFVRHHCAFLDRMIIVNNRSRDNTAEILGNLVQEGLPLDIRTDNTFVHRQGEAMTELLRELAEEKTDLIVPLDADEFLLSTDGSGPRTALEHISQDTTTFLRWRTYVPLEPDPSDEQNVLRRITHRKVMEQPQWYKVMIPGTLIQRDRKLQIGSHALVDGERDGNVDHRIAENLFLAHFPVRSPEQIAAKVCGGWPSHVADPKRLPGTIFQWKAIFDMVKEGKKIDAAMLTTLALEYATHAQWNMLPKEARGPYTLESFAGEQSPIEASENLVEDPVQSTAAIRYAARPLTPLMILAESAEHLAEINADLKRKAGAL